MKLKPTPLATDPATFQLNINGVADTGKFNGVGNLYTGGGTSESDDVGDDEFNEEMPQEDQSLPDTELSSEEDLEEMSSDEPQQPTAIIRQRLRRNVQVVNWIRELYIYKSNRSNQQVQKIFQQLNAEQQNSNSTSPEWRQGVTAVDITNDNIALAIVALHKLGDLDSLTDKQLNFVQQPASSLPGEAIPLFHLQMNGVEMNDGNGEEKINSISMVMCTMLQICMGKIYPYRGNRQLQYNDE